MSYVMWHKGNFTKKSHVVEDLEDLDICGRLCIVISSFPLLKCDNLVYLPIFSIAPDTMQCQIDARVWYFWDEKIDSVPTGICTFP